MTLDKRTLTEHDICTKFVTPALEQAGWDIMSQIREQYYFTKVRVLVRGKTWKRGERNFADYLLFYKPNIKIAVVEAKGNNHSVSAGIQQGLEYAKTLDVPFVFSTNGDGFLFHDRTVTYGMIVSATDRELAKQV